MGLASGIAQAGVGLGQFVIPPVSESLMENWGMVHTFIVLSVVTGSGLGSIRGHPYLAVILLICLSVWASVYSTIIRKRF